MGRVIPRTNTEADLLTGVLIVKNEKNVEILLDNHLLKALDNLIEQGVYRDRDDAIRIAISEKLHYLKQAGNVSKKPESEQDDWPDYLEDKFGGPSV